MREAVSAIQQLHMFDMGNGIKLGVKVSEKIADRERRLAKKREEDEFLNSLSCTRKDPARQTSREEDFEMDAEEAERGLKNPFIPQYTTFPDSASPASPSRSPPTGGSKNTSTGESSLSTHSSPSEAEATRIDSKSSKLVSTHAYTDCCTCIYTIHVCAYHSHITCHYYWGEDPKLAVHCMSTRNAVATM